MHLRSKRRNHSDIHGYIQGMSDDTPVWYPPFGRFRGYSEGIDGLIELTLSGAQRVRMMPELYAVLDSTPVGAPIGETAEEIAESRDKARALAQLAEREATKDFPLLFSHSLISLWGALEVLVEDVVAVWLQYRPEILMRAPLSDLKFALGDFERLERAELIQHVVVEAQRMVKTDLKVGAGQFESLLRLVELGGEIAAPHRDALFYMQQFRHVFAHRGGTADRRFIEKCSALEYEVGDSIRVGQELFHAFHVAANFYALNLFNRCAISDGREPRAFEHSDGLNFDTVIFLASKGASEPVDSPAT